jgi:hypothetical protein
MRLTVAGICLAFFICFSSVHAQNARLKPGFDKAEYRELLKITAMQVDANKPGPILPPDHYKMIYRSPVVGLDNRWDLWYAGKGIAVISIRGTTANQISWLENLYAAMVPAAGTIKLSDDFIFNYQLAQNARAAVHVGWLIGMAFLSRDVLPKIDSLYKAGIKQYIILGHSQGGAIAFLLTAYLENQRAIHRLPQDIRLKTYSSAAPKPGNLYFSYDYESLTMGGWGLTVVNTADWVPETPVSVQTLDDFNIVNPFADISPMIKKQKFPKNIALRYAYNRLKNASSRARRRYEKYLGRTIEGLLKKSLSGYEPPSYANSFNYIRCGQFTVLQADTAYYQKYPDDKNRIFIHHGILPYLYLTDRLPE